MKYYYKQFLKMLALFSLLALNLANSVFMLFFFALLWLKGSAAFSESNLFILLFESCLCGVLVGGNLYLISRSLQQ